MPSGQPHQAGRSRTLAGTVLIAVLFAPCALAQSDPPSQPDAQTAEPTPADDLAYRQSQLADKFGHLETLMLRSAEYDGGRNPRRASLLRQALAQSKENQIRSQLETLVTLLNQKRLSPALEGQQKSVEELQALLELLLTENRPDRLKSEQQRVRGYIQELERIIRQQRGIQGRTEGGDDANRLAGEQGRVAERAGKLGQQIDENEQSGNPGSREGQDANEADRGQPGDEGKDGQPNHDDVEGEKTPNAEEGDDQSGKSEPGQGQDGDPSGQDDGSSQGEGQGENQQGQEQEPGQEGQGQGQSQTPGPPQGQSGTPGGQSGGSDQPSPQPEPYPGRQRIADAEQKMREAQKRLEEAKRNEAVDEQEEARRLLEQAKAELEKILRQLREEEIERMLALLESRFRKMLEMQLKVYESTTRLDKTPVERRDRQVDIQAGKLSLQQRRIVMEADKTLALLREEGSSVAFPEAVEQMREDMQQVVDRLARSKIGSITQGIEEDIIAALEEMIEALQQAQEDQAQRQQNQQTPQSGPPEDPSLVDALAELRLIKALQLRVNRRTGRYAQLLGNLEDPVGQATDEELMDALEKLSEREQRIFRITRDIVLGRNQ